MSSFLLTTCYVCLLAMFVTGALCLYRIIIGPKAGDRAVALDTIASVFIGIICILCMAWNETFYFDAVWILTLAGFIGTAAIAKYLHKGRVF